LVALLEADETGVRTSRMNNRLISIAALVVISTLYIVAPDKKGQVYSEMALR